MENECRKIYFGSYKLQTSYALELQPLNLSHDSTFPLPHSRFRWKGNEMKIKQTGGWSSANFHIIIVDDRDWADGIWETVWPEGSWWQYLFLIWEPSQPTDKKETKESNNSSGDLAEMKHNSGWEDMVVMWERGEERQTDSAHPHWLICLLPHTGFFVFLSIL